MKILKTKCMRNNAWSTGVPSAIVDHWLEVFALMVAREGRKSREAYRSFTYVMLQASAASPTFSEVNFDEMVRQNAMPVRASSLSQPPKLANATPSSSLSKPKPAVTPKKGDQLPMPLKPQKFSVQTESRAQKLSTRLDALVTRIERLKGRLNSNAINASTPQPADDPLPSTSAASSWEANDLNEGDLSLDDLEKRISRLARGK